MDSYNKRPHLSRDIQSHEHADNFKSEWFINSNPRLKEKTFNEVEGWELSELFAQFYFLRKAAEMFGRGEANIAKTIIPLWKDEAKVKEINEVLIPMVTKRIIEILTPSEDGSK